MASYAPPDAKTATKMTAAEQAKFITDCREKLDAAYNFERENRREAAMDMAFVAGYQWPESIKKERQAAGRPILTINRLPAFIDQIIGDARQNKVAIKVFAGEDGDVDAGSGGERITAGSGHDVIFGNSGDDYIYAGSGTAAADDGDTTHLEITTGRSSFTLDNGTIPSGSTILSSWITHVRR